MTNVRSAAMDGERHAAKTRRSVHDSHEGRRTGHLVRERRNIFDPGRVDALPRGQFQRWDLVPALDHPTSIDPELWRLGPVASARCLLRTGSFGLRSDVGAIDVRRISPGLEPITGPY